MFFRDQCFQASMLSGFFCSFIKITEEITCVFTVLSYPKYMFSEFYVNRELCFQGAMFTGNLVFRDQCFQGSMFSGSHTVFSNENC